MQNRPLKMFLVSLVSFVLLYYSVAWAVLRCFHDEDHSVHGVVVQDARPSGQAVMLPSTDSSHGAIDCIGLGYHVESLAAPAAPVQFERFAAESNLVPKRFLYGQNARAGMAVALEFRHSFQRQSTLAQFSHLPLYLSLAVLRL